MAIVFPSGNDKESLISYVSKIIECTSNGEETSLGGWFCSGDIDSLNSACDSILNDVQMLSGFFCGGDDFTPQPYHNGFGEPQPFFFNETVREGKRSLSIPELSALDLFGFRSLYDFFKDREEEVVMLRTSLESAREALQEVNRSHAYVWTTDIASVKGYWKVREKRKRQLLSLSEKAGMRAASSDTEASFDEGDPGIRSPTSVTSNNSVYSAEQEERKVLMALRDDLCPTVELRESYAKFIQVSTVLEGWMLTVLSLLRREGEVPKTGTYTVKRDETKDAGDANGNNSQTPKTKTVRVTRYEIRDIGPVFAALHERAHNFFLPHHTTYDTRTQRRILKESSLSELRNLIAEYTEEIHLFEELMEHKTASAHIASSAYSPYDLYERGVYNPTSSDPSDQPKLVFRPPLTHFYLMRSTLRIYLSTSINVGDLSSCVLYQQSYSGLEADASEVKNLIQKLPPLPVEVQKALARNEPVKWMFTPEERKELTIAFETYWEVRKRLNKLRKDLSKNIKRNDCTHCTKSPLLAVENEKSPSCAKAERRFKKLQEDRQGYPNKEQGFWSSALGALLNIATCKAELDWQVMNHNVTQFANGGMDDEGDALTEVSPYHKEKQALLKRVQDLWESLEREGEQLEAKYRGLFFRGIKEKWTQHLDSFINKASSVSVVFDP